MSRPRLAYYSESAPLGLLFLSRPARPTILSRPARPIGAPVWIDPFYRVAGVVLVLALGGCRSFVGIDTASRIEPFATVEPLDQGQTFLEVDPVAHRERGAVIRVNERAWGTEAVVQRGDRVEVAYRESPGPSRLTYRVLGRGPQGWVRFELSRGFDDGFPAQEQRLGVRPYRDAWGSAK
ncbi:MAG: hypothetical protein V3V20_07615 [Algisphaera sp.]